MPTIKIALTIGGGTWTAALPKAAVLARRAVRVTLAHAAPRLGEAEVSLLLADDKDLAALNRDFRGQKGPTNVLSFPGDGAEALAAALDGKVAKEAYFLGDIAIGLGVLRREAKAEGKTLAAHFTHLVVHGMLHLLGYDHHDALEAARMENLEIAILGRLGCADPYGAAARPRTRR